MLEGNVVIGRVEGVRTDAEGEKNGRKWQLFALGLTARVSNGFGGLSEKTYAIRLPIGDRKLSDAIQAQAKSLIGKTVGVCVDSTVRSVGNDNTIELVAISNLYNFMGSYSDDFADAQTGEVTSPAKPADAAKSNKPDFVKE